MPRNIMLEVARKDGGDLFCVCDCVYVVSVLSGVSVVSVSVVVVVVVVVAVVVVVVVVVVAACYLLIPQLLWLDT